MGLRKGMPTMTSEKGWKTGDADEFLEDIMTEHVHEWARGDDGFYPFICSECNRRMTKAEALTRINATERLSAEDARVAANDLQQSRQVNELLTDIETIVTLRAYTDILEGKDET